MKSVFTQFCLSTYLWLVRIAESTCTALDVVCVRSSCSLVISGVTRVVDTRGGPPAPLP